MNVHENLPELLTLKETCEILNCHENTLRQWDKKGVLAAVRVGVRKDRKYKKQDVVSLFHFHKPLKKSGTFQIQNRRFLGNKYKLLDFIEKIVLEEVGTFRSFADIFAGTGVVGHYFNRADNEIISNDLLFSNYLPLKAFLGVSKINFRSIEEKIGELNDVVATKDNYFSTHFGDRYFDKKTARKIGSIREKVEQIAENSNEKAVLLSALIYAADRIANTVGHYDAYRECKEKRPDLLLKIPDVDFFSNKGNKIYNRDANELVREIESDVLYIDPPYNSRQYSDTYHLLENLARWEKPAVFGKAQKMKRTHLKSRYSLASAADAMRDLIENARCKHILISYNNTGETKNGRSNARISDADILDILSKKGKTKIYEQEYRAFTAGKSDTAGHTERVFYCRVTK